MADSKQLEMAYFAGFFDGEGPGATEAIQVAEQQLRLLKRGAA